MERKDLEALGLSKEQVDKVMAANGKDIEQLKTENDDLSKQLNDTKTQLETATGSLTDSEKMLKDLKAKAGDNDELKGQLADYQKQLKQAKADGEAKLAQSRKAYEIMLAVQKSGAKDAKIVSGLIDPDKVTVDGKNITGLTEQIDSIKTDHDYLFESDKPSPSGQGRPAGNPPAPNGNNGKSNADLASMTYAEAAKALEDED